MAERDQAFLAELKAAEDKYKIEVERHAKLLFDTKENARTESEQAARRLASEKELNRDNL